MVQKNTLIMSRQDAEGIKDALTDAQVSDYTETTLPKGMTGLTFRTTDSLTVANNLVAEFEISVEVL